MFTCQWTNHTSGREILACQAKWNGFIFFSEKPRETPKPDTIRHIYWARALMSGRASSQLGTKQNPKAKLKMPPKVPCQSKLLLPQQRRQEQIVDRGNNKSPLRSLPPQQQRPLVPHRQLGVAWLQSRRSSKVCSCCRRGDWGVRERLPLPAPKRKVPVGRPLAIHVVYSSTNRNTAVDNWWKIETNNRFK